MNPLRTLAAITILGLFVFCGSATCFIPNRADRLTARLRINRRFARALAGILGLRIEITTPRQSKDPTVGRLLLANHTSVLDVIALATLEESVFVTSRDMAESLPIRWLSRISGTALIERRNRNDRRAELENLEQLLREGRTVVLFPEATSTNGGEILRFRNGLLPAALRAPHVEVVPVCLQYLTLGREPVSFKNRDRLFLHGEIGVAEHLLRLFTNSKVRLGVRFLPKLSADRFTDCAELASRAESLIRENYRPITA